jgi:hypothetical protein
MMLWQLKVRVFPGVRNQNPSLEKRNGVLKTCRTMVEVGCGDPLRPLRVPAHSNRGMVGVCVVGCASSHVVCPAMLGVCVCRRREQLHTLSCPPDQLLLHMCARTTFGQHTTRATLTDCKTTYPLPPSPFPWACRGGNEDHSGANLRGAC